MSGFCMCGRCSHIDADHGVNGCKFCSCSKFVQPGEITRAIAAGTSIDQLTGLGRDGPTLISGKPVGGGH